MQLEPERQRTAFGLFDPDTEVLTSERNLPHWFQPGVAAFITFRTADSLPQSVLELWHREQLDWLRRRDICLMNDSLDVLEHQIPLSLQSRFQRYRDRRWHSHLDQCHGACVLRQPELSQIVSDSLLYFRGTRYDLDSFVVMPNHVHVLAQFRPPTTMQGQCKSWLRFTARQINRRLKTHGAFWQSEPFDNLVRSENQFTYLQKYIADNPRRARLPSDEFRYWQSTQRD